jgi:hypothetical protein
MKKCAIAVVAASLALGGAAISTDAFARGGGGGHRGGGSHMGGGHVGAHVGGHTGGRVAGGHIRGGHVGGHRSARGGRFFGGFSDYGSSCWPDNYRYQRWSYDYC